MADKSQRKTPRDKILDTILDRMESENIAPWTQGWVGGMPYNIKTGNRYSGINTLSLWAAGYNRPGFMTYKQAIEMGGNVRKGEHGTSILYFNRRDVEAFDPETSKVKTRSVPYVRGYYVFNETQLEGINPSERRTAGSEISIESFIERLGIVFERGRRPAFIPETGVVWMPFFEDFESEPSYYKTLFHEIVHWSGGSERLNRPQPSELKDVAGYAEEELVAEIGSAFLAGEFGIELETERNAAYCKAWLEVLRNDKSMLSRAATTAQAAVNYLLEMSGCGPAEVSPALAEA